MKTSFSNKQCAHVWAQRTQEHGHSGSMSFRGGKAYSYSTLQANLFDAPNGRTVCLFTERTYSVTTSRHVSHYWHALAPEVLKFTVPYLEPCADGRDADHARNLTYLRRVYADALAALMRAPGESWKLQGDRPRENLRALAHTVQLYADAFAIAGVDDLSWMTDADAVEARRDRLLNSPEARARAARKLAAEKERERRQRLTMQERLAEWRNGARVPWFNYTDESGSALFRIVGDNVETSRGATVPVEHVRRVMKFYTAVRASCRVFSRESGGADRADVTLGHFVLDSIDIDGNVRAGCHFFSAAEVENLARMLGGAE